MRMSLGQREIWCEDACEVIARDLRKQAERWEKRADEIRNFRGNIRPTQDPSPALKAAIRVLTSMQNGLDPIQECRRVCRMNYLEHDQVWRLYEQKKAAWERDQRKKRNQAIVKMSLSGKSLTEISRIFGLSKGQVSKIINPPIRPKNSKIKSQWTT